jgi:N-acetylglucosaminyl-diphospho-decaprenol L-rhamnosyltransferase
MTAQQDGGAPSVAVVVVSFGAHELLEANLAAIDLAAANARVVIVDNFFSADERAAVSAIADEYGWAFVPMATNVGFGSGMNHGVAHARLLGCSSFLLLNPDARVSADVVRELARACAEDPMTLVSPRLLRADGSVWFRGSYLDERTGNVGAADQIEADGRTWWLTAACLMVHDDLWLELGGFDPDYFLYWEDTDLSRRCCEIGGQLSVRNDLIAVHDVGGTQVATGKSTAYYYYNCRNRLVFAAKHLSRRRVLRWIAYTPIASRHILYRGGGRRQMMRSPGLFWAAVRGSFAGIAIALRSLAARRRQVPIRAALVDERTTVPTHVPPHESAPRW